MLTRLFDGAVAELTRGLSYASARHRLLAEDIANAETPGYQPRDVVFDDVLRASAAPPAGGLMPADMPERGPGGARLRLVGLSDGSPRPEGSPRVDTDRLMARLAENTLVQHTLVQVLANRFTALKQAISGRV